MSFISSAIPGAIVALLILFFMREPARIAKATGKGVDRKGALSLLTNKAYLASILGYAAVTFSLGGISWWMASFLQRVAGYSEAKAGGVMGPIIVIAGLGGTAFGGYIAQVWSRKTSKALYFVPAISAALTVPPAMVCFFGPTRWIVPSLSLAVFLIFLGTGPVNASTLNAVPANLRATAMAGQLFTIHVLGDAFSPKLIGLISDHSNLRMGLGATLVTMLVAAVIFAVGARYAPTLHNTVVAAPAA